MTTPVSEELRPVLAMVDRLYKRLASRRSVQDKADRYYRGQQPLAYATDEWKKFHASRYTDFSDNWCGVVADSPAERLRVSGFSLPADDDGDVLSAGEAELWSWWERNDGDQQSSQGFLASIVSRRSFVLVWADDDDEPQMTWEHPDQVIVDVDPGNPRRRRAALKVWRDDDLEELATLYTPDLVFKFQRKATAYEVRDGRTGAGLHVPVSATAGMAGGWVPREVPTDDAWPLVNPMGDVPVVEFPNRPMLGGEPISDIAGTMAMQDAVNLLWAYLFTAADYASMPARVVMGQEPPKLPILDENGQKVGEKPVDIQDLAKGRLLWLTGQTTTIGEFKAASLDAFTDVIEVAVGHIAAQTRTPPHYLVTNKGLANLSGDALKAAETGLVKKVEEQQLFFGTAVREVFRLLALAADRNELADAARVGRTSWRDAESRSESQLVDALQKLQAIGFPFQWLAMRYGLSEQETARVVLMRQQELDSDLLGTMGKLVRDQQLSDADTGDAEDPAPAA